MAPAIVTGYGAGSEGKKQNHGGGSDLYLSQYWPEDSVNYGYFSSSLRQVLQVNYW